MFSPAHQSNFGRWFVAALIATAPILTLAQDASDVYLAAAARVRSAPRDQKVFDDARSLGFEALRAGRYENAVTVFTATLDADPGDQPSLYGRALALFNLQRTKDAETYAGAAVEAAVKTLSTDSKDRVAANRAADALTLHAVILAVLGKTQEGLKDLTRAVAFAPENFDAQFAMGRAYYGVGDLASAAAAFRAAIALRPLEARPRFFLATTLERSSDLEGALVAYRELVKLAPTNAEGHLGLGALLVKRGGESLAEGMTELQRAIEINDGLYEARISLGRALVRAGRAEEAIAHLQRAAKIMPENPEPRYQLALAYRKLGRATEAAEELKAVQRLNEERRRKSQE